MCYFLEVFSVWNSFSAHKLGATSGVIASLVICHVFHRDLGNAGLSGQLVSQLGVLTKLQYL